MKIVSEETVTEKSIELSDGRYSASVNYRDGMFLNCIVNMDDYDCLSFWKFLNEVSAFILEREEERKMDHTVSGWRS